jgi:uncharacterized protein
MTREWRIAMFCTLRMNSNCTLKAAVSALILAVGFAGSVAAGPFEDGEAAFKRGDYATTMRLLRPLADQGNATAQYKLGVMYEEGHAVRQDYAAAASWYRKAADQGDAAAQNNLGVMYDNGRGVRQDYAAAASWFRKAADQGAANAQSALGGMYSDGRGVPQNYTAAAKWYRKAADQGDAQAQSNLGFMYATGQGVRRDEATAVGWFRKAADQGRAKAQSNLGLMYGKGQGVSQDYVSAHMWLSLASAGGEKDAAGNRDIIAASMTPPQLAEARKRAAEWRPRMANAAPPQAERAGAGTLGNADAAADTPTAEILARAGLREQAVGSFLCRANDAFEDCVKFQEKRKAQCRSKIGTTDERSWCVTSAAGEHFCATLPNQLDRETCTSLQSAWADVFSKNRKGVLGVPAGPTQASSIGVPLKMDSGILVVPVEINGTMKLDFVIDSGAADVSVPADVVSTLKRAGTIKESDFVGQRTYVLADGSKSQSATFMIRSLRVGDMVVENVRGSVASSQGSLLLGQSFLERFKSWSIDNTKHELLLESR